MLVGKLNTGYAFVSSKKGTHPTNSACFGLVFFLPERVKRILNEFFILRHSPNPAIESDFQKKHTSPQPYHAAVGQTKPSGFYASDHPVLSL